MQRDPHDRQQNQDAWDRELRPDPHAGHNQGPVDAFREIGARTAFDVKAVHRCLRDMPDDELKQVPVLAEGDRLRQGGTYLDLTDPARGEFTASGEMAVGPNDAIVPKDRVPYPTWNRLRGVRDPERL